MFQVQKPGVLFQALMLVYPLFWYKGLSEGIKGLFAFTLLPVIVNAQQQFVLKVSL